MKQRLWLDVESDSCIGIATRFVSYLYHAEVKGIAHECAGSHQLYLASHTLYYLLVFHLGGTGSHLGKSLLRETLFIHLINNIAYVGEVFHAYKCVFRQKL